MSIFELFAAAEETAQANAAPKGPRRINRGTDQQEALWSALAAGSGHVLAEARAGCGKSSSCREGMWRQLERLSTRKIRYAVYNKAMAEEFRGDCPPLVEVGTCHAFGYESLRKAFPGCQVNQLKTYAILDSIGASDEKPWVRRAVARLVSQSKGQFATTGPEPDDLDDLLLHYDIPCWRREDRVIDLALQVLEKAAQWTSQVDYDDMLWLPVILKTGFPPIDALYIDEAQDWSPIQHLLVPRLCPAGRVVVVGDRFQAIYAWRGADADSLPNLAADLAGDRRGLETFPLTITFRCPQSHVALARDLVPDLTAHASNAEGTVLKNVSTEAMLERVRPGDRVICPTNAPVVRGALRLIAERRAAKVRGRAIGDSLTAITRSRYCAAARTVTDLGLAVERWRSAELDRLQEREAVEDLVASVNDRADGLQAVLLSCDSPDDVAPLIALLFSDGDAAGAVNLSTVHRAKGLEANTVWFIDQPLRRPRQPWQAQQQRNLRYVALTRSRDTLCFVEPDR